MNNELVLILGPMYSGKTTLMFDKVKRYHMRGLKCVLVKPMKDKRYTNDGTVSTHDGTKMKGLNISSLLEIENIDKYDVIGIEEAHLFDNCDLSQQLKTIEDKYKNKNFVFFISTLNGTFNQKPLEQTSKLLPLATEIIHLTSVCYNYKTCGNDKAGYTKKIVNSNKEIEVGGEDMYLPTCAKCKDEKVDKNQRSKFKNSLNGLRKLNNSY